jgi:hypothetical protein
MVAPQETKENILAVSLAHDHTEPDDAQIQLKVNLTIDGVNPLRYNDDDFEITELIKSTTQDGIYFPWTCSCGEPGCAGYFEGVDVKINEDFTIWSDKDQKKIYTFKTVALKAELQALHDAVVQWNQYAHSVHAELNIAPGWTMKYLLPALGIS